MMGFNKIEYLWLMEYLSQQRYDELAAELNHLITEVYPKVKEDLAPANRKHCIPGGD